MGAVYPTTPVQDGMPKPQIPLCVQRLSGLWYCYDDQGNLVYIGNSIISPQQKSINRYPQIFASAVGYPGGGFAIYSYNTLYICGGSATWGNIFGDPFFGSIMYSGSVSVPVGTSSTYGATTTIYNNNVGARCLSYGLTITLPVYITVTWGGSFASGETVSVKLTFNISQTGLGTISFSPSTTLSATATGSQSLNFNDIIAVIAPAITTANTYYTVGSVTAAAASSASSTSVTVSVQVWYLTS
jgi:hypothetical protein